MAAPQLRQLELAILCAINPNADPRKPQALQLCNSFKESPDAWRSCVQLFASTSEESVKFFTLQTLQYLLKTQKVSNENRRALRVALLQWTKTNAKSHYSALPIYVKKKFAIVIALLIKSDLLSTWPTAFTDIQSLLVLGESAMHLWIRILYYIDEEVVNPTRTTREDLAYCSQFKDHMRAHILSNLVNTWLQLLEHCSHADPSQAAIAKSCLKMVSVYVPWIDISFSANPRFLGLLAKFVPQSVTCHAALMCLESLLQKGMPPLQKLKLMQSVNLTRFFTANRMPLEKPEAAAHAARFFGSVGRVALDFFAKKTRPQMGDQLDNCRRQLSDVIQLSLPFLNYGDARGTSVIAVTKEILPFFVPALKLSKDEAWIARFDKQVCLVPACAASAGPINFFVFLSRVCSY